VRLAIDQLPGPLDCVEIVIAGERSEVDEMPIVSAQGLLNDLRRLHGRRWKLSQYLVTLSQLLLDCPPAIIAFTDRRIAFIPQLIAFFQILPFLARHSPRASSRMNSRDASTTSPIKVFCDVYLSAGHVAAFERGIETLIAGEPPHAGNVISGNRGYQPPRYLTFSLSSERYSQKIPLAVRAYVMCSSM
jgi:hypothetical protein